MKGKPVASLFAVGLVLSLFAAACGVGLSSTPTDALSVACIPPSNPFIVTAATWGTQANPIAASPRGVDVPMTVTMLYTGGCALASANFRITPGEPLSAAGGSNMSNSYAVNIGDYAVVTETYNVDIGSNARLGTYTIPLYIGYNTTDFSGIFSESTNFTIALDGSAQLRYVASSSALSPGQVNEVGIVVSNIGTGDATHISTTVVASATVSVLNTLPEINALAANASATQVLDVYVPPASAESPVTLTLESAYTDSSGTTLTTSQFLGMFVVATSTISPVGVTVSPTYLQAGAINNLSITISNSGTSAICGLSASFSLSGGLTWLSPSIFQAPTLAPGREVNVQAQLYDPSSGPAAVTLQVPLKYTYQNITTTETMSLGLLSRGVIDIEMTGVTVIPQVTLPGQVVSVTLTVTNVGVIEATGVTAQAQMPISLQPIGSASDFIGDMQVDTPYTFTLSALVSNATSVGNYTIPVTFSYLDNLMTHHSEALNVTVAVGAATSAGMGTDGPQHMLKRLILPAIAIVVVAVVVVAVFLYLRRRRSSKSLNR